MRTSPKRSINDVIIDGRLARQANVDKFITNANKSNQKPLELIDAKSNRRVGDINWRCLDVAVLCWLVSVLTVVVFVAYLNGVFA